MATRYIRFDELPVGVIPGFPPGPCVLVSGASVCPIAPAGWTPSIETKNGINALVLPNGHQVRIAIRGCDVQRITVTFCHGNTMRLEALNCDQQVVNVLEPPQSDWTRIDLTATEDICWLRVIGIEVWIANLAWDPCEEAGAEPKGDPT